MIRHTTVSRIISKNRFTSSGYKCNNIKLQKLRLHQTHKSFYSENNNSASKKPLPTFQEILKELSRRRNENIETQFSSEDLGLTKEEHEELMNLDVSNVPIDASIIIDDLRSGKAKGKEKSYLQSLFLLLSMRTSGEDSKFKEKDGIKLVYEYFINKENELIIRREALNVISAAMNYDTFKNETLTLELYNSIFEFMENNSADMILPCLEVLTHFLELEEFATKTMDLENIQKLVNILRDYMDKPDLLELTLSVLLLVSYSDENRLILRNTGAIQYISNILDLEDNQSLRLSAAVLLANQGIYGDKEQIKLMDESDAIKKLCQLLISNSPLNYATEKAIIRCLEYVTLSEEVSTKIGQPNYIPRFINILEKHIDLELNDTNKDLSLGHIHNQSHFFAFLSNLTKNNDSIKIRFYELGIIKIITNYLKERYLILDPQTKLASLVFLFNISSVDGCRVQMANYKLTNILTHILMNDESLNNMVLSSNLLLRLCDVQVAQDEIIRGDFLPYLIPKLTKFSNPDLRIVFGSIISKLLTGNLRVICYEKLKSIDPTYSTMEYLARNDDSKTSKDIYIRNMQILQLMSSTYSDN